MPIPHPVFTRQHLAVSRRRKTQSLLGLDSKVAVSESDRNTYRGVKSDTLFAALPVELRVEIFRQVCDDYCSITDITEGPILLLRVCSAWKELVLQTPQLWTSFALNFNSRRRLPGPMESEFLIRAMNRWLDRSRNLPLSFEFHCPVLDATCIDLIRPLLSASVRWRDVTLHAPSTSLLPLWEAGAPPDRFPSMQALSMETVGASPFLIRDLGINWAQLVKVNLFFISIPTLDECLHILREGVNLTQCSMNAICVLSANAPERFALPKLEYLQLKLYGGEHGGLLGTPEARFLVFLGALSLPGLKSLSLGWHVTHGPGPAHWSDVDKFAAFLEGLEAHLCALHLAYFPFDTRQALRCLAAVPSLRQLTISLSHADEEHDFIDNEYLRVLTLQPGCKELLPLLQRIRLESHSASFSNPVLLRFIASRWKYHNHNSLTGHLERVELFSSKRRAEYLPRWFRDVKEGRLDVAAGLKAELSMVDVLGTFLDRDSYTQTCFMNCDFPPDICSLLVFS